MAFCSREWVPGGQKVNKVATAAELRFNVKRSSLPEEVKERLSILVDNRINPERDLFITGRRYTTARKKPG